MTAFRLGLTGSIGMGKSTTAAMFAEEGLPVWDADAAVHRLYGPNGAAVAPIAALCLQAQTATGLDRDALKRWISTDASALAQLEAIVHPLVAADRDAFIASAQADIVVLDIPLLFEKGTETQMDTTLLCTAPPALQKARVMARGTLTEDQLQTILARQMPDAEKRAHATHIVETLSLDSTRAYVRALITHIREGRRHA
jgi:dephospho-CoA kinase